MSDSLPALPKGWVWTNFDETSIKMCNGISKRQNKDKIGIPVTRIETISNGEIDFDKVGYLENLSEDIIEYFRLCDGDILFSNINSDPHLGKTALFNNNNLLLLHGMNLLLIRPNQKIISPKFLNYLCNFYRFSGKFIDIAHRAVNQSSINQTNLKNLQFPLAPISEQHRIITKIEELFTKLDAGEEALHTIQTQLKVYRQAVLKAAMTGKLTEQWRVEYKDELEPASVLLEKIREERKKKLGKKYKELPPIDMSNLPQLPGGWIWVRLGDILISSNDKFNPISSKEEKFVGLEHINGGTGRLLGYGSSLETRSTKTKFRKGDLLYGKLRPYLNKVCIVDFDGICSTDILVFSKHNNIDSRYVARFLLGDEFVKYANQHMSGVQHPRINFQTISNYIFPVPPLIEQQQISNEIERRFSVVDNVVKTVYQGIEQAERLRQSILKRAFEGKLVPQDQTDEPAAKLLERIKAE